VKNGREFYKKKNKEKMEDTALIDFSIGGFHSVAPDQVSPLPRNH
jgi:hypothetical protein